MSENEVADKFDSFPQKSLVPNKKTSGRRFLRKNVSLQLLVSFFLFFDNLIEAEEKFLFCGLVP